MAWHSFEIFGMQLRQGRGCVAFVLRTSVLQKRGVCSCWDDPRVYLGMEERFRVALKGRTLQQLSELWFRQSVCWRQLTAAAQAASSLTRKSGELRQSIVADRQPASVTSLEQVLQQARKPKPAAGERPAIVRRGTFPKNLGCTQPRRMLRCRYLRTD